MRGLEDGKTTSKNQEMTGDKPWKKSKNIQDKKGLEGMPGSRNNTCSGSGSEGPWHVPEAGKSESCHSCDLQNAGRHNGRSAGRN